MRPLAMLTLSLTALGAMAWALRDDEKREEEDEDVKKEPNIEPPPSLEAMLLRAESALEAWKGLTETDAQAAALLVDYWRAVGWNLYDVENYANANGYANWVDVPWSAAALSWIAKGLLVPSASHVAYVAQALAGNGAFEALPNSTPVRAGDIVVKGRGDDAALTLDDVRSNPSVFRTTHGDLVTFADKDGAVLVGGNKGNAVSSERIQLVDGFLPPEYFTILRLKNSAPPVYASVPGYRRANDSELTPEMRASALAMLPVLELGEVEYFPGWAVAAETHSNAPKGMSVFLPEVAA